MTPPHIRPTYLISPDHLNGITETYVYDQIYQLTQVLQGTTTTEAYTYDKVGNRLSSLGVPSYTYNNSNQLTATSNATYTYDNNGNTLTKTDASGTTQYAWDYENRLASVTLPGGSVVSFKYDPTGRRIQKGSASGTTNYVYDRADGVEEVDATGATLAHYAMGPKIDQPLSMLLEGATSYYEADGLGSVTSLGDSTGSAVAAYTYDSFGRLTSPEGGPENHRRYTGREFDTEIGIFYYRARYYDSQIGRFVSEDPVRAHAGKSFYAYVLNNPLIYRDSLGLQDEIPGCKYEIDCIHSPAEREMISHEHDWFTRMDYKVRFPNPISMGYANYSQCRGTPSIQVSPFKGCKISGQKADPAFQDDFGNNAMQPTQQILPPLTIDFEKAKACLQKYPMAALDPRFNPTETFDPNDDLGHLLDILFERYPWW